MFVYLPRSINQKENKPHDNALCNVHNDERREMV